MKIRSKALRVALVVAIVLTCQAGTIADQLVTTTFDETQFTADHPFIKCNKAICTGACDRTAPATGHCVDVDAHIVMVTSLECCCCEGYKHTKNLKFYPYNY